MKRIQPIFVIGPPRCGTTILGTTIGHHPQIAVWIEPYFIWDRFFRDALDDCRTAHDANETVRKYIHKKFSAFGKALKRPYVLDKSPRNSLKIPFVRALFPDAYYIFIIRDGRDAVLSINKMWNNNKKFWNKKEGMNWPEKMQTMYQVLQQQPLWYHRIQALLFEIGSPRLLLQGKSLTQIRWGGRVGWGPRFKGWQGITDNVHQLEFCAYQWMHAGKSILQYVPEIPKERYVLLKYEDFISKPEKILQNLFSFLHLTMPSNYLESIPEINKSNSNKWCAEFSKKDLELIGPIIGNMLINYNYEKDHAWYKKK